MVKNIKLTINNDLKKNVNFKIIDNEYINLKKKYIKSLKFCKRKRLFLRKQHFVKQRFVKQRGFWMKTRFVKQRLKKQRSLIVV